MILYPFKALYPKTERIHAADNFFDAVKAKFPDQYQAGYYQEDPDESLFVYSITGEGKRFTGIIACASIEDYLGGNILQHEETISAKEKRIVSLLVRRGAMIKPVLLTYPPQDAIGELVRQVIAAEPAFMEIHFAAERELHQIFRVRNPGHTNGLKTFFLDHIHRAYIADGHHRFAASANLYKSFHGIAGPHLQFEKVLCVFIPSDQLVIHDYNRVVDILDEIPSSAFMHKLAAVFSIRRLKQADKPGRKHDLTMYLDQEWYLLRWKEEVIMSCREKRTPLDTDLLNRKVLEEILMIRDITKDSRIRYVHGLSGLSGLIDKTRKSVHRVGFCLYPVPIEDMMAITEAGETLPPKSTWFEPRIKNGLISARIPKADA